MCSICNIVLNGSHGIFSTYTAYCGWVIKTSSHLGSASWTWLGLISILLGSLVDVFRCNTIREDMSVLRTLKVTRPHKSKERHITVTTKCINSIPYIIIIDWIWNRPGLLCHSLWNSFPGCYQFIWLCFFGTGALEKEKATITGGLSSLAMLTTPLMAVMQLTRLLWVRARGDSRSVQQPQGENKILPLWW